MVKNLPTNAGDTRDMGWIPGSGRSREGGHGDPLQYCFFFFFFQLTPVFLPGESQGPEEHDGLQSSIAELDTTEVT